VSATNLESQVIIAKNFENINELLIFEATTKYVVIRCTLEF